ncbi:glycerate kinase [Marinoscillum pacificum]|uniref:glycerate kinase n=1 Tax=Marinoscillum pacificum TaxID=392723 RepID=UPI002157CE95|nr:glycerate kinase [Marinoscillum pacificum]
MKVIICPNAFKGSLSAEHAAEAIARGLKLASDDIECVELPIADGGDGSLGVIAKYLDAEIYTREVAGPCGSVVEAKYGWHDDEKLAIIELAEASGIRLLEELDPWNATTYGTGELIQNALKRGATKIYLTIGGSASVDGAIGILDALGVEFIDLRGKVIENPKPSDIKRISEIKMDVLTEVRDQCQIHILCDVVNPLLGDEGAARVFGPQKGLEERDIPWFDDALKSLADHIEKSRGLKVHDLEHGGAAGGVAAILNGALDARLIPGGDTILEWAKFKEQLESADVLITGEGRIDQQTNFGKGPGLVARLGKEHGLKVIGLSGSVNTEIEPIDYFDVVLPIINGPMDLSTAMKYTYVNLERTAYQLARLVLAD